MVGGPLRGSSASVRDVKRLTVPELTPELISELGYVDEADLRETVRSALEAQAHQVYDLMKAFEADGEKWERLRIDGGMAANDWLAQDLADMLDLVVERPAMLETTALGAAMLAAVGAGLYSTLANAVDSMRGEVTRFEPMMSVSDRQRRLDGWRNALARV